MATRADPSAAGRLSIFEIRANGKLDCTVLPIVLQVEDAVPTAIQGGTVGDPGTDRKFEAAAEVMNLERSILITGDTDGFFDGIKEGLHTIMFGGKMVVDYVRVEFFGQRSW